MFNTIDYNTKILNVLENTHDKLKQNATSLYKKVIKVLQKLEQ